MLYYIVYYVILYGFSALLGFHQLNTAMQKESQTKLDRLSDHFLPKISFVNSLPIDHNRILQLATYGHENWTQVSQGGRKLDARIKSGGILRPMKLVAMLVRSNFFCFEYFEK